jgi:exodeoxyribonuclease VII small subunit
MAGSEKGESEGARQAAAGAVVSQAAAGAAVSTERFDEILVRLRGVVEKLEGGNLSLEDSLKFFEEGIGLCRRGATILDSAERKVEVLLAGSAGGGGRDGREPTAISPRTVPFDIPAGDED